MDLDLFRSQLAQFDDRPENFFVLLSEDDQALRVSRFIAGGVPRVGAANAEELASLGVTVVDLSKVDDNRTLSHSKFAASPEIVRLIGRGLNRIDRFDESEATPQLEDALMALSVRILF
ncbi:alpha/beta hydrolase [Marimonas sp. MJW-29]|uniref:Alpha/beta hydrolase n=1 Tax=Sulfitobacter sediminis TaxID=3234186 RepID=A0ABV3RHN0_9RHOB